MVAGAENKWPEGSVHLEAAKGVNELFRVGRAGLSDAGRERFHRQVADDRTEPRIVVVTLLISSKESLVLGRVDLTPGITGDDPAGRHKAFLAAYQKRYNDYPRLGSIVGYLTMKSLAAGIAKAGSTDTEKLVDAFRGLEVDGPFGPFVFRASDHQSTLGAFVGKIALKNGHGTMVDFKYVDGASALPSNA